MNTIMFHDKYPEFKHRLVVKKTYDKLKPIAVDIRVWLTQTFGPKGNRWQYQPLASPDYLVYWFRDEKDLVWAKLKWM